MRIAAKQTWLAIGVLIAGAAVLASCRRKAAVAPALPVPVKLPPAPTQPEPQGKQQDWRSLVEARGLSRYAPALAKLARPAVQLQTRRVPAEKLAIGQSRIGGVPDLPLRFAWPTFHGKHLAFIAQVNLSDVARDMADGPLPKTGHLWFFYVWDQMSWGGDLKDAGSAVVHYEANAKLARRVPPRDIPDEGRFRACAVTFRVYEDIPGGGDSRNPTSEADDATQGRYYEMRHDVASVGATSHKLLGYSEPIQGEMESECEIVTRNINMDGALGEDDPRFKALDPIKYQWRLLLQVDSDDAADMMWGDVGRLYFWIREQDLRARRFDKTWMIFQCG